MASQERFELPTDGLEGRCSIQLSYWDINYQIKDKFYYISLTINCQHKTDIFLKTMEQGKKIRFPRVPSGISIILEV